MDLSDQIRIAREAAGLTQAELAEALGKTKQSVVWWETGAHIPRLPILAKMETVLSVRFNATGSDSPGVSADDVANVKPEHIRLALSISRLPKANREAIINIVTTLESLATKKL